MCGGTRLYQGPEAGERGLSPRVRGNPAYRAGAGRPKRSIPACAGEPARAAWERGRPQVYPRVCGGTLISRQVIRLFEGLSPRVRGNPTRGSVIAALAGSIPACAGEPRRRSAMPPAPAVYPRVCGGTHRPPHLQDWGWGLSPRVRGNHGGLHPAQRGARSIPACAGEPRALVVGNCPKTVYPRVCGGTSSTR